MADRRKRWRWWLASIATVVLLAFIAVNVIARQHARALLEFSESGTLTLPPEQLSGREKLAILFRGITIPKPQNHWSPDNFGLPYETIEVATNDGVTLSVWVIPASNPVGTVALFHGYSLSKASLLHAATAFHQMGWTCYVVDFRGSGDSSEHYTTIGFHEARDVAAVVGEIDSPGPVVLYGESMGAAAILRALAHEGVEADAAILDAPFDRMLAAVRNRFELVGLPGSPGAELLVFWGGRMFDFDAFEHNPVEYAASVSTPTLVVHGGADPFARPAEVSAVFDALAGPKQIAMFEGVVHEPIAIVRPEEWRARVDAFLRMYVLSQVTRTHQPTDGSRVHR